MEEKLICEIDPRRDDFTFEEVIAWPVDFYKREILDGTVLIGNERLRYLIRIYDIDYDPYANLEPLTPEQKRLIGDIFPNE